MELSIVQSKSVGGQKISDVQIRWEMVSKSRANSVSNLPLLESAADCAVRTWGGTDLPCRISCLILASLAGLSLYQLHLEADNSL